MRAALLLVVLILALPSAQAARRAPSLDDINAAEPAKNAAQASESANIRAQVLLDRARFSPGAIDGRRGENFAAALRAFQRQNELPANGDLDAATFDRLTQDSAPAMITYTISDKDVAGPFTRKIPHKLEK
ncbi:MAG: peptidoglycan-binding protein, partial [Alphaproteobacteria bacterium]|nr:peptidoglycan-binding protein [Alphaproteobacteria bacterium]